MSETVLLQEEQEEIARGAVMLKCPKCGGALFATEEGKLKCYNCSRTFVRRERSPNGLHLDSREKTIILDALTEVYLRTKGNIKRSLLPVTRQVNEERAKLLEELLEKISETHG